MRRMTARPFAQVDVFTAVPYMGNPLAVVADAEGLTTEEMQRLAAWTNLSETTFLLEPSPDPANQATHTEQATQTERGSETERATQTEQGGETSQAVQTDQANQSNQGSETGQAVQAEQGTHTEQGSETSQAVQTDRANQSNQADYRVRIFTPDRELPFAGHPTLGTCRVWLDQGGVPRRPGVIVQECGAGLVSIRVGNGPGNSAASSRLAFAAPPLVRSGPVSAEDLALACEILDIDAGTPGTPDSLIVDANWVENGPPWMAVLLRSAEDVLALRPQAANPHDLFIGAVGPYPSSSTADPTDRAADPAGRTADPADRAADRADSANRAADRAADRADFEVRAFFPKHGVLTEDPVTGSLNASLGQWLTAAGHATAPYTASQGAALGRDGRIYVDSDADGTIWVGGDVVTCIQGTVDI